MKSFILVHKQQLLFFLYVVTFDVFKIVHIIDEHHDINCTFLEGKPLHRIHWQ